MARKSIEVVEIIDKVPNSRRSKAGTSNIYVFVDVDFTYNHPVKGDYTQRKRFKIRKDRDPKKELKKHFNEFKKRYAKH